MTYSVESRQSIKEKIIPHFLQYPLKTKKAEDFKLFCSIIELMEKKEHHTMNGLIQIMTLAFQMNPNGKNRKYKLDEIIIDLKESSETTRQTYIGYV